MAAGVGGNEKPRSRVGGRRSSEKCASDEEFGRDRRKVLHSVQEQEMLRRERGVADIL